MNSTVMTTKRFDASRCLALRAGRPLFVAAALGALCFAVPTVASAQEAVARAAADAAIEQIGARAYDDAIELLDAAIASCGKNKCPAHRDCVSMCWRRAAN